MKMQLTTVNQWVHDQDEALEFYTEKLGMELRMDVTMPEMGDFRWLTVGPVGQPDIAVVLMTIPGPPVFEPETRRSCRTSWRRAPPADCSSRPTTSRRPTRSSRARASSSRRSRCNSRTASTPGSATRRATTSGSCRRLERPVPREGSARAAGLSRASVDREQVDDEHERLVRRDHAAGAAGAVGHRGGDRQLPPAADLHPLHAGVPARDHLALAELERERLRRDSTRRRTPRPSGTRRPRSAPSRCGRSSPPRRRRRRCPRSRARTGCRLPACRSAGALAS